MSQARNGRPRNPPPPPRFWRVWDALGTDHNRRTLLLLNRKEVWRIKVGDRNPSPEVVSRALKLNQQPPEAAASAPENPTPTAEST